MHYLKTGLYIFLGAVMIGGVVVLTISESLEHFISDIHDNDMYTGGNKDDVEL